jgi:hypothetical protein
MFAALQARAGSDYFHSNLHLPGDVAALTWQYLCFRAHAIRMKAVRFATGTVHARSIPRDPVTALGRQRISPDTDGLLRRWFRDEHEHWLDADHPSSDDPDSGF